MGCNSWLQHRFAFLHTQRTYTCNAYGLDLIRAPHYSANLAADYVIPSSVGDFDLNANVSYTDSFYWFPEASERVDSYLLANL